jgi:hypothetical protein
MLTSTGRKSKWPAPLLVFTTVIMVAAFFWIFGGFESEVLKTPLDEDNSVNQADSSINQADFSVNMHQGTFEKMVVFDVPISVSTAPTNYQATIKVIDHEFQRFEPISSSELPPNPNRSCSCGRS